MVEKLPFSPKRAIVKSFGPSLRVIVTCQTPVMVFAALASDPPKTSAGVQRQIPKGRASMSRILLVSYGLG